MEKNKHYINLCLVFLLIIGIPALQSLTHLFPENKLNGVVANQPLPKLNWDNWYHFRYQPKLNAQIEQHFGFRTSFVKLYNQLDYSLFHQAHGAGIVLGKKNYLFEEWFITAYYGKDFVGEDKIKKTVSQVKQARDYFKNIGKELMVVIAPGKADFFPEFIPDHWKDTLRKTNYQEMSASLSAAGIPLLDFNKLFVAMKDTASCLLFPKTGTHWSHYGSRLATDSLSGFVSALLKRRLPDIHLGPSSPADTLVAPDGDLESLMNLYFPLSQEPLCYPEVIANPAEGMPLPSAIVIGDSFFWPMFNLPLNGRLFQEVKFWYYNSTVYPDSYTDSLKTSSLHFPEAFTQTDLIILMVNPSNIQNIGWGFLDRVTKELYQPGWQKEYDKMVKEYIQAIHNTPDWEKKIAEDALKQGISTDSMIRNHARYMVDQYLLTHDMF